MRKALYILADLDDHDLIWLQANGVIVDLADGETVIAAGQPVVHLYFVTSGALTVALADGKEIARLAVGDVIGEMSFVEKRPPDTSVRTDGPCRLLRVPISLLLAEFARNPGFAARFYRALAVFLSDRLRTATAGERGTVDSATGRELDEGVLDTLHVAGDRMRRLIDLLEGRARS